MNQRATHPLDILINDNSLIMLEAMVPFVDYRLKKLLVIYIKYREFTLIMNNLNDIKFIDGCGFNKSADSTEDMVDVLLSTLSPDAAANISSARKMLSMMQAMEGLNNSPDLSSLFTAASNSGANAHTFTQTPDSRPDSSDSDLTDCHTASTTDTTAWPDSSASDNHNNPTSLYDSILNILEKESEI